MQLQRRYESVIPIYPPDRGVVESQNAREQFVLLCVFYVGFIG